MQITINLPVRVEVYPADFQGEPDLTLTQEELAQAVEKELAWWDEGRYSYAVEALDHHLAMVLQAAIKQVIGNRMKAKYGNERVEHKSGSHLRSYIETDAEFKRFYVTGRVLKGSRDE